MSASQKLAAYPHLYSFTSTKSVVHWFQIIRTKSFQMYDDDVQPVVSLGSVSKYTKVAKFPTRNIKTPIVLLYGGSDSLVDINVMLKELPPHTVATEIPHYEHLDFLWAREVDTLVFPHVFDALESFCDAEHSKEEYERYRSARHASLGVGMGRPALPFTYVSEDDSSQTTFADVPSVMPGVDADAPTGQRNVKSSGVSFPAQSARKRTRMQAEYDDSSEGGLSPISPTHRRIVSANEAVDGNGSNANANGSPTTNELRGLRSGSMGSLVSFEGKGSRGIILGAAKPVSGVVKGVETVGNLTKSSDDDAGSSGGRKRGKR